MKKEEFDKKTSRVKGEKSNWFSLLVMSVVYGIVLFSLLNFVILLGSIPSPSMEPTLTTDSYCMLNRLAYLNSDPERGDIVAFKLPDCREMRYIKRIVGLPGETVEVIEGFVYIDGEALDEPYVINRDAGSYGPYVVPEGHYFMLGDNRSNSRDSRKWFKPFVPKEDFLAKYMFTYLRFGGDEN